MNQMSSVSTYATDDERWVAVVERDGRAAGRFVYAVDSTGVYCWADCPSRRPRRDRVRFFATPADAEIGGFRACQRCRPDRGLAAPPAVARACRAIEAAETMPPLTALAKAAHLSVSAFHRQFKKVMGMTPAAYAAALRERRLRDGLAKAGTVTEALYDAGYGSSSRLYERSQALLGMTPSRYRKGGEGEEIRHAIVTTSLGLLLVAATERGLCLIALGDKGSILKDELGRRFPNARILDSDAELEQHVKRVAAMVENPSRAQSLPLDIRGTAFQQKVWRALRDIVPGRTQTYAQIAKRVGAPKAVRAVGAACGANPLSVVVPCHRALGSDGKLHGYRWGLERKRTLLAREGVKVASGKG